MAANKKRETTTDEDFLADVILEEYKSLREENVSHIQNKQQITYFSIALLAGLFAVLQVYSDIQNNEYFYSGLLVLSVLFSSLGLIFIQEDMLGATIGKYINKVLRVNIKKLSKSEKIGVDILGWDEYKNNTLFRSVKVVPFLLTTIARFMFSLMPSILLLVMYWTSKTKMGHVPEVWEEYLYYFAFFSAAITVAMTVFNGVIYLEIGSTPLFLKRLSVNKFITPLVTLAIGFIPVFISSWLEGTLFPSNRIPMALLTIPSVFLGDSILLPIFNYYFILLLSETYKTVFRDNGKAFAFSLTVSLIISLLLNIYTHTAWVNDARVGYIETGSGSLSVAGWFHFVFSTLQMAVVIIYLVVAYRAIKFRLWNSFQTILTGWRIFTAFTFLAFADFLFQVYIFYSGDFLLAVKENLYIFRTPALSIFILVLLGYSKRKQKLSEYP